MSAEKRDECREQTMVLEYYPETDTLHINLIDGASAEDAGVLSAV